MYYALGLVTDRRPESPQARPCRSALPLAVAGVLAVGALLALAWLLMRLRKPREPDEEAGEGEADYQVAGDAEVGAGFDRAARERLLEGGRPGTPASAPVAVPGDRHRSDRRRKHSRSNRRYSAPELGPAPLDREAGARSFRPGTQSRGGHVRHYITDALL
eukprot:tig00000405_g465.t1